jgi:hypothetical protein
LTSYAWQTISPGRFAAASSLLNPTHPSLAEGARSTKATDVAPAAYCSLKYSVTSNACHAAVAPEIVFTAKGAVAADGRLFQVRRTRTRSFP